MATITVSADLAGGKIKVTGTSVNGPVIVTIKPAGPSEEVEVSNGKYEVEIPPVGPPPYSVEVKEKKVDPKMVVQPVEESDSSIEVGVRYVGSPMN